MTEGVKFRLRTGNSCDLKQILKAHCHDSDWINKTIKKKRIRPDSVISLYSEIHEDDNDLIPFILETKHDPRAKRLRNCSKARALLLISTSQLANHNHDSVPLNTLRVQKPKSESTH